MADLGKPEILILLIVIFVLFGAQRLPGAARSLGQSLRVFKAETKGLRQDEDSPEVSRPVPGEAPAVLAPLGVQQKAAVPPVVQDEQVPSPYRRDSAG